MHVSAVRNRRSRARSRRGAVVVIVAVMLVVLFGVAALSIDIGRIYRERCNAQAAADAAAEAGAIELYTKFEANRGYDRDGMARSAALETARANGYGGSNADTIVTVNIPPLSGPNANLPGYVEVIISGAMSRSFSAIYSSEQLSAQARAVAAGTTFDTKASVLVLDPKRKDSLRLKGKNSSLEVKGDIFVNSKDKRAVTVAKKSQIVAEHLLVVGGMDRKLKGLVDAEVSTGVMATPDPLESLPTPPEGTKRDTGDFKTKVNGQEVFDLPPGKYKELKFNKDQSVRMQPGVYYVEGEVDIRDTASLAAEGVMIYNAGKKGVKIQTSGSVTITPPTSGTYQGISFFQNRTSKTKIEFKNDTNLAISGVIYAANSEVKFKNSDVEVDEDWESESDVYSLEDDGGVSSTSSMGASLIAKKLTVEKGSQVRITGADISIKRPLRGLVE